MLERTVIVELRCTDCGAVLESAEHWSRHRSQHTIEFWARTAEGRLVLKMLESPRAAAE